MVFKFVFVFMVVFVRGVCLCVCHHCNDYYYNRNDLILNGNLHALNSGLAISKTVERYRLHSIYFQPQNLCDAAKVHEQQKVSS